MYAKANHPWIYEDAGKWYFWHEDRISYEGPFVTDWQASRAAYGHDLARETDKGREGLDAGAAEIKESLNALCGLCRSLNDKWWRSPDTLSPIERNGGELIALMHSELSEALEGLRKDRADEHLPHRKSVEVELADTLIRIFDFAGELGLDLGGALVTTEERGNLTRFHLVVAIF